VSSGLFLDLSTIVFDQYYQAPEAGVNRSNSSQGYHWFPLFHPKTLEPCCPCLERPRDHGTPFPMPHTRDHGVLLSMPRTPPRPRKPCFPCLSRPLDHGIPSSGPRNPCFPCLASRRDHGIWNPRLPCLARRRDLGNPVVWLKLSVFMALSRYI
jgi:hypothetical protein